MTELCPRCAVAWEGRCADPRCPVGAAPLPSHTPGVWIVRNRIVQRAWDGTWVAVIVSQEHQREANAALIAAAPDMLAALEASRECVIPTPLREIFDAAIQKVKAP